MCWEEGKEGLERVTGRGLENHAEEVTSEQKPELRMGIRASHEVESLAGRGGKSKIWSRRSKKVSVPGEEW